MKITIDSKVLEDSDFDMQRFAIVLYYLSGGKKVLDKELCEDLRESGFLKRTSDGYAFHEGKLSKIKTWIRKSSLSPESIDRLTTLAKKLREIFPDGRRSSGHYWRDNTKTITDRLSSFIKKFGNYDDDKIIEATKAYVASFNGDYSYMQLLKYFIYKKDLETGEINSQLSNYLENSNEKAATDSDWTTKLI